MFWFLENCSQFWWKVCSFMPHEDNTGGDSCACNNVGDVD